LWAAGFFALCGFKLNFMTICILPMLLATSSDYGIYIVHRFTFHGRSDMQDAMQVAGLGVILSALTTLEGFGTLALSVNRGIASVGLIALVGISACFLAALFTLPATLHIWGAQHHQEDHGYAPGHSPCAGGVPRQHGVCRRPRRPDYRRSENGLSDDMG
jgi:predicted RND superfamily exporter protein